LDHKILRIKHNSEVSKPNGEGALNDQVVKQFRTKHIFNSLLIRIYFTELVVLKFICTTLEPNTCSLSF